MTKGYQMEIDASEKKSVALFATCLVDMFRPQIGFAAAELIEALGFELHVPKAQTCCGQPLVSSGDFRGAKRIARHFLNTFSSYDFIVAPSGSCVATIKLRFASLFDDPKEKEQAKSVVSRCLELTEFLELAGNCPIAATHSGTCAYHDSCSGLRELGIQHQPRNLLSKVAGLIVVDLPDPAACCGFGGAFCVKYPEISSQIANEKADNVEQTLAPTLLGGDLGCLMNIAGTLSRRGSKVRVMHVAEMLAGGGRKPGICEPSL